MTYDPTVFKGTAEYYASFRPPKPESLFKDIVHLYKLSEPADPARGCLFDLGCGTGEMSIPLAAYFTQVHAWDPDPEMIEIAKQKVAAAGLTNFTFEQKSSEELEQQPRDIGLVTMGQSFHWMDNRKTLQFLSKGLAAGSGVVIVSGASPTDTPQSDTTNLKNELVSILVKKYLGPKRRAGKSFYTPDMADYGDLLSDAGFSEVHRKSYTYVLPRTVDEIVGELYSMSWASKAQFGSQADAFETELRAALAEISTAGNFDDVIRFDCFLAKK
jgi:ubiquinone/menaquinone biosynthesis C-methylase UbiE